MNTFKVIAIISDKPWIIADFIFKRNNAAVGNYGPLEVTV